jgi:hypothetical protein
MAEKSKQHFVAQCYTTPWCDPAVPKSPTSSPYVWTFDKDGTNVKRNAPANLFTEKDMYTVPAADGSRDLYLEDGFGKLEDLFTRVRNKRLSKKTWPTYEEWVHVMMFVATSRIRTLAFRNFHRQQWAGIRERMEEMQASLNDWTAQGREAHFGTPLPGSTSGRGMGIEQVERLEQRNVSMTLLHPAS